MNYKTDTRSKHRKTNWRLKTQTLEITRKVQDLDNKVSDFSLNIGGEPDKSLRQKKARSM